MLRTKSVSVNPLNSLMLWRPRALLVSQIPTKVPMYSAFCWWLNLIQKFFFHRCSISTKGLWNHWSDRWLSHSWVVSPCFNRWCWHHRLPCRAQGGWPHELGPHQASGTRRDMVHCGESSGGTRLHLQSLCRKLWRTEWASSHWKDSGSTEKARYCLLMSYKQWNTFYAVF